jgi:hypothetical protein
MKSDVFWSLFAMPIGLLICFGPAILVWLFSDSKAPEAPSADPSTKH